MRKQMYNFNPQVRSLVVIEQAITICLINYSLPNKNY